MASLDLIAIGRSSVDLSQAPELGLDLGGIAEWPVENVAEVPCQGSNG